MATEGLNHFNIAAPAALLSQVRDFYVTVVGLEEGYRPDFGVPGYWLYANDQAVLHLLEVDAADQPAQPGTPGFLDHVAFTCRDLDETEQHLRQLGVDYRKNDFRDFGLIQLFVRDPTGLGVEMNFAV
jgi:catechol 2,3-dioxygenase-like lactoylglutathione lyase family enzyme